MHRSTQVSGGSDLNPLLAAGQIAIGENKNTSEGDQVQGPEEECIRTLNATRPMMTPAAKKAKAWMSQMTPHTDDLQSAKGSLKDVGVDGYLARDSTRKSGRRTRRRTHSLFALSCRLEEKV